VNANLDDKIVYLGMDVSADEIKPGQTVTLTHYWKVNAHPGEGWKVFTHVNGPNQQGFLNFDHRPVRGKYPAAEWKAGEIIRDEHPVRLPESWPHDKMTVYVGLWRGQDRLKVKSGPQDGQNRVLAATLPIQGKKPPIVRNYVVRKVAKPPKLDGKMDDAAWANVPGMGTFVNTMNGATVPQMTDAKMVYDDKNLYVVIRSEDSDVWGAFDKRDAPLWQQEVAEIMIDAGGDGQSYVEFQISPRGTIFDTYLPTYRKYEDSIDPKKEKYAWDSGIRAAVSVEGTLNDRDDEDKAWVAEIAIPLVDVNGMLSKDDPGFVSVPPAVGDKWRINLFRMDAPKGKPQTASGWSPPLVGDFHKLDRFGTIVFADSEGRVTPPPASQEVEENTEKKDEKPAEKATEQAKEKEARLKARKERIGRALDTFRRGGTGIMPKNELELEQPTSK
jgi:hypothetical protein